jgi:hypothetical protein
VETFLGGVSSIDLLLGLSTGFAFASCVAGVLSSANEDFCFFLSTGSSLALGFSRCGLV